MSAYSTSWFHCGRCGSLFLSPADDRENRVCPECGRNPSLGTGPGNLTSAEGPTLTDEAAESTTEVERVKHPVRRARRNLLIPALLTGWILLLGGVILVGKMLGDKNPVTARASAGVVDQDASRKADDAQFLNQSLNDCAQVFSDFLLASSPSARSEFVRKPIETTARMARFYELNPAITIAPASLAMAKGAVLRIGSEQAIEAQWMGEDGQSLDAVFRKEEDSWRLDWDHFVRYSDYPWSLFLAGSGEESGEFRLLARERLTEARKKNENISIVLYAPRFGFSNDTGFQSPEFLIERSSTSGQRLTAAFNLERSRGRIFAVDLPSLNPDGLIRIRARIRRITEGSERRFELEEVKACHWYETDEQGLPQPAEKPAS